MINCSLITHSTIVFNGFITMLLNRSRTLLQRKNMNALEVELNAVLEWSVKNKKIRDRNLIYKKR